MKDEHCIICAALKAGIEGEDGAIGSLVSVVPPAIDSQLRLSRSHALVCTSRPFHHHHAIFYGSPMVVSDFSSHRNHWCTAIPPGRALMKLSPEPRVGRGTYCVG